MFTSIVSFYVEEFLGPFPNPQKEDHLLSAAKTVYFNIFAATPISGDSPSIRNLRARHGVVTKNYKAGANLQKYFEKFIVSV